MADDDEEVEVEVVDALFAATEAGDTEELARLLDEDPALLEAQNGQSGATPLVLGAMRGHVGVVQLCLGRGAQVEARDRLSLTALQHAAMEGHTEVALTLLRAGADADTWDAWFLNSPLIHASSHGHAPVVCALLPYLDVSALHRHGVSGCTALWRACRYGHALVALLLLRAGAKCLPARPSPMHPLQTPREVAASHGHHTCVALLDWWGGEVCRAYVLHRARALHDITTAHDPTATATATVPVKVPACLQQRVAAGRDLPHLTLQGQAGAKRAREEEEGEEEGGGKRGRAEKEGKEKEEEERERLATAAFVLHDLPSHLYVELHHGMRLG